MPDEPIRERLRRYLLDNFLPGEPAETLADDDPLITGGIIASLSLVELVAYIEDAFGVTLEQEDIGASRMDSVDALVDLVSERRAAAGA